MVTTTPAIRRTKAIRAIRRVRRTTSSIRWDRHSACPYPAFISEGQPHSELNISGNASGIGNPAHLRGNANIGRGDIEVRVVHDIEEFGAKLEVDALGDAEPLIRRLVPIYDARAPK